MVVKIVRTKQQEAEQIVKIYDQAFYADYLRYGNCPGYGHSVEEMEQSIQKNLKYTIYADHKSVGVISATPKQDGEYHIGCLCIVPEYQHKGIGCRALELFKEAQKDWIRLTLETPADKVENVSFYTDKCGFQITGKFQEGKTTLYSFRLNRRSVEIRRMEHKEYPLLTEFLYEAVYQPDPEEKISRDVIETPELQLYISRFGEKKGDLCDCAVVDGKVAGAAWVRYIDGYGNVCAEYPELAISVLEEYRGQGIGSELLSYLLEDLKTLTYPGVSLSVQKENYASGMYRKAGFVIVRETEEEYLMIKKF